MARLAEPTTETPTSLAVVADPHLSTRATGTDRQYDRTESFVRAAFTDIDRRDIKLTVSVGDLTKDGAPWDVDRFEALVESLSTPFRSVPGNHDVPKDGDDHEVVSPGAFAERFVPGGVPFHECVGGVDLLGLNTASAPDGRLSDAVEGYVSEDQLDWLAESLDNAEAPVVVGHHNLPDFAGQFAAYEATVGDDSGGPLPVQNADRLVEACEAGGAGLYLSGHYHTPGVGREGTLVELAAPSLCQFPQGYLVVDVDSRGTTVRYVPIGGPEDGRTAYAARAAGDGVNSKTAVASVNLSQFPLVEEWRPGDG
jgi:3',5'-cyclic AMP phosphodiesterase CpdA